jgi:hypothetical protein
MKIHEKSISRHLLRVNIKMAGTPSLKIKLRLNAPSNRSPSDSASPKASIVAAEPTLSPLASVVTPTSNKRDASEPAQQSTPKRARGGPGSRSKRNPDTAASTPQAKSTNDLKYVLFANTCHITPLYTFPYTNRCDRASYSF